MKLKITLLALVFTSFFYGQTTAIPDTNFEQALVDLNIDSNGMNGNILNSDAQAVIDLSVSSKSISNLSGIEAFTNLTVLNARVNNLTSINISNLTQLEHLELALNNLTSINLSNNSNLKIVVLSGNRITSFNGNGLVNLFRLRISDNQAGFLLNSINISDSPLLEHLLATSNALTSLNLSNNSQIKIVNVWNNNINSFDISSNPNVVDLNISENSLTSLNIANGNNQNYGNIILRDNPNLSCIQVDDVTFATSQPWIKDATANYSTNCAALSVYDQKLQVAVNIYPNPTFNTVNIETPHTIRSLKLTNISGQVIFETKTALNRMDLTAYNAGIYFISIETDKGVSTKKIIKQ